MRRLLDRLDPDTRATIAALVTILVVVSLLQFTPDANAFPFI